MSRSTSYAKPNTANQQHSAFTAERYKAVNSVSIQHVKPNYKIEQGKIIQIITIDQSWSSVNKHLLAQAIKANNYQLVWFDRYRNHWCTRRWPPSKSSCYKTWTTLTSRPCSTNSKTWQLPTQDSRKEMGGSQRPRLPSLRAPARDKDTRMLAPTCLNSCQSRPWLAQTNRHHSPLAQSTHPAESANQLAMGVKTSRELTSAQPTKLVSPCLQSWTLNNSLRGWPRNNSCSHSTTTFRSTTIMEERQPTLVSFNTSQATIE